MHTPVKSNDYLVSTVWLSENLSKNHLRILDVSGMLTSKLVNRAKADYFDIAHIPNSQFFDVAAGQGVLSQKGARLPWTWPEKKQFEATMAEFGIDNNSHVIIVARTPREVIDSGTMWCTRAWWTMHHYGVHCSILTGGIEKWLDEKREMTTAPFTPPTTHFVANETYHRGLANKDDVARAVSNNSVCLIDTLSTASFDGTDAGYGPRKGHIKSAINIPFHALLASETANFHSEEAIAATLADSLQSDRVITYCGGAIAATVNAFWLKKLGHNDVSVYDASLMEWSADKSLPMVNDK